MEAHSHHHQSHPLAGAVSLDRTALMATLHCLARCAIGKVIAAYPVNRWLIARGRGHALVHAHH